MRKRQPRFDSSRFASLVQQAGRQIGDRLKASALISQHQGTSGAIREGGFREFLRQLLPERYYVGTGFAFDATDAQSRQLDIVVASEPPFVRVFEKENVCYLPCEAVLAVIEVKKTLTAREIRTSLEIARSIRQLKPYGRHSFVSAKQSGAEIRAGEHRCFYSLVAFDSDISIDGWAQREWDRIKGAVADAGLSTDLIDRLVILDRGIINGLEGSSLDGVGEMNSVIFNWFVHLSNHLDREVARRPQIDLDVYTRNRRWNRLV